MSNTKADQKTENKGHLVASIKKQGENFIAMYEGETETFPDFGGANQWIISQENHATETPELAASDMDEADAEKINSNINVPVPPAGANDASIHS